MAGTLVINPGSSSKKFALYEDGVCLFTLRAEKTADGYARTITIDGEQQKDSIQVEQFEQATADMVTELQNRELIRGPADILRVGIRVVAPGTYFQQHRLIDTEYVAHLQDRSPLAPLHTPQLLREIAAARAALPDVPLIGVSDSAFHATKPAVASAYSIPSADAETFDIHRFGYHGLSVASVARRLETIFGGVPPRTIVAHVGSGVSLTALQNGQSIDTTMGFSPESGLIMGTRAGDVDCGALLALMHHKQMRPFDAHVYLSTRGGFQGLMGNSDLRYVLERRAHGDGAAQQTLAQFAYQFRQAIGAYYTTLGGLDAIVLTATAVVRNADIRAVLLEGLEPLGIRLAAQRNHDLIGAEGHIHATDSAVKIQVLKTDEMDEIARSADAFCAIASFISSTKHKQLRGWTPSFVSPRPPYVIRPGRIW